MNALVNVSGKALGDQVKEAVRRGIPYFIAYGENEAAEGRITLKVLAESREESLPAEEAAAVILGTD